MPTPHQLARLAYPLGPLKYRQQLIKCIINGVPMTSYEGHHAEVTPPDFAFMDKFTWRNDPTAAQLPTLSTGHQPEPDELMYYDGAAFIGESRLNADYARYYEARYPEALWFAGDDKFCPVQIIQNNYLVAIIAPEKL